MSEDRRWPKNVHVALFGRLMAKSRSPQPNCEDMTSPSLAQTLARLPSCAYRPPSMPFKYFERMGRKNELCPVQVWLGNVERSLPTPCRRRV